MTIQNDRLVSCRIPEKTKLAVENFAKDNNTSLSGVIRLSLALLLERENFLSKLSTGLLSEKRLQTL
jgi:hypothetical protein